MKVLCFGDSNTYGYDPRSYLGGRYGADSRWVEILRQGTGWQVVNWGENGREIPQGPVSLPGDLDLMIVMLGTNDLLQGRPPERVAGDMRRFLQSLSLNPSRLLLIAPPPMVPGEWVQDQRLIQDSGRLARYYQALAQDLEIGFADAGAWQVSLAYDGVHFTEQGHRAFAAGLMEEIWK